MKSKPLQFSAVLASILSTAIIASSASAADYCKVPFTNKASQELLKAVDFDVKRLSSITINTIDAVRFVEIPEASVRNAMMTAMETGNVLKDLSWAERSELTTRIMDYRNNKRSTREIIRRFLFEKNKQIAIASTTPKADKALLETLEQLRFVELPYQVVVNEMNGQFKKYKFMENRTDAEKSALITKILDFNNNGKKVEEIIADHFKKDEVVKAAESIPEAPLLLLMNLEGLRHTELPYQLVVSEMKNEFKKFHFLENKTEAERSDLITAILDFNNNNLKIEQIIKNFFGKEKIEAPAHLKAVNNNVALISIRNDAKDFFDKKWDHMADRHQQFISFLEEGILADPKFQNDPVAYMQAWQVHRGWLEMLIIPNDPVMRYLEKVQAEGKLENLANKAKAANIEAKPEEFLSKDFKN